MPSSEIDESAHSEKQDRSEPLLPVVDPDDPGEDFLATLAETKLAALVETLYLAAFADGEFSQPERDHFSRCVEYLTRGRLEEAKCNEILAMAKSNFETHGRDRCIEAVKNRLTEPSERVVALVLATDMAVADGVLHPAEKQLVLSMASALEIDEERALGLLAGLEPAASGRPEG